MKVIKHHILAGIMAALMAFSAHVAGAADAEVQHPTPAKVVKPYVAPYLALNEGEVTVVFRLDESGRPLDIEVVSATDTKLVESVQDALSKWRFDVAPVADKLGNTRFRMPFIFTLEG